MERDLRRSRRISGKSHTICSAETDQRKIGSTASQFQSDAIDKIDTDGDFTSEASPSSSCVSVINDEVNDFSETSIDVTEEENDEDHENRASKRRKSGENYYVAEDTIEEVFRSKPYLQKPSEACREQSHKLAVATKVAEKPATNQTSSSIFVLTAEALNKIIDANDEDFFEFNNLQNGFDLAEEFFLPEVSAENPATGQSSNRGQAMDDSDLSSDEADLEADSEMPHSRTPDPNLNHPTVKNFERSKLVKDPYKYGEGIKVKDPPIDTVDKAINHMMAKVLADDGSLSLKACLSHLLGSKVKVGSLCSGSETFILALNLIAEAIDKHARDINLSSEQRINMVLKYTHHLSAEIEPFKQAYIQRNFAPQTLLRDITEFFNQPENGVQYATTAYGSRVKVPSKLDLLVVGFCCVDFSVLNYSKKTLEELGESGDTFHALLKYAEHHEPKIIILENVKGAPWNDVKYTNAQKKTRATNWLTGKHKKLYDLSKKKVKTGRNDMAVQDAKRQIEKLYKEYCAIIPAEALRRGIDYHLSMAGYAAIHIPVDSKDYYIPQTRERGYMVAVNRKVWSESFPAATDPTIIEATLEESLAEWVKFVQKLKNPASAPTEDFLTAAAAYTGPTLNQGDELDGFQKPAPWPRCKVLHAEYREVNNFGHQRTLTSWRENGFKRLPDFWKPMKGLTERVLDVFEIAHLRGLVRGYDDRFYNRFYDLGQNVYRLQDTIKNGHIGCLLPTGIAYCSAQGRILFGKEVLLLQGVPVDRLDVDHLTEKNLTDFAGNAMTLPVIAAAILSVLAIFHRVLQRGDGRIGDDEVAVIPPQDNHRLILTEVDPSQPLRTLSVLEAKHWAKVTSTLCDCEGNTNKLDKIYQRCNICHHTTCTECGINPKHSYEYIKEELNNIRQLPAVFEDILKQSVPQLISFRSTLSLSSKEILASLLMSNSSKIDTKLWEDLGQSYEKAFESEVRLQSISRGKSWKVLYTSAHAKLRLEISEHNIEWHLYAILPPVIGISNPMYIYLAQNPIARLQPADVNILDGPMSVLLPKRQEIPVTITSYGNLIKSCEGSRGLVGHEESYHFDHIDIQTHGNNSLEVDIGGPYELHQHCDQAFDSLHVQISSKNSVRPLYLLFEHQNRRGRPSDHSFIFSHHPERTPPGSTRIRVASIEPSFRSSTIIRTPTQNSWSYSIAGSNNTGAQPSNVFTEDNVNVISEGTYTEVSGFSFVVGGKSTIKYRKLPSNVPLTASTSCREHITVLETKFIIPDEIASDFPQDEWLVVNRQNRSKFFHEFSYVLKAGLRIEGHSELTSCWQELIEDESLDCCEACTPRPPAKKWSFKIIKPKTKRKKLSPEVVPSWSLDVALAPKLEQENELQGTGQKRSQFRKNGVQIEHAVLKGSFSKSHDTHGDTQGFQNREFEKHPKNAKVPELRQVPFEDPEQAGKYEQAMKSRPDAIVIMFRIDHDKKCTIMIGINPQTLAHRARHQLSNGGSHIGIKSYTRLVTDAVDDYHPFKRPKILSNDEVAPLDINLPTTMVLRNEQAKACTWMNSLEDSPPIIEVSAVSEACITEIRYRLEAVSTRQISIRGGLVAHPVGFGKTILVLALIHLRMKADEKIALMKVSGRISVKATLVMVPPSLCQQWASEAALFLGEKETGKVIVIQTIAHLKVLSIADFKAAEIVIINWNVVEIEAYLSNLAQWAGMIEPDSKASLRAKSFWYESCIKALELSVETAKTRPYAFDSFVKDKLCAAILKSQGEELPIPSKRATGAAYVNFASRTHQGNSKKRPLGSERTAGDIASEVFALAGIEQGKTYESLKFPPLEAFFFSRVVADEFPYLEAFTINMFKIGLARNFTWLMSGTPNLDTFEDINFIARLFQINLGPVEFSSLPRDKWRRLVSEMTDSEKFMVYQPPFSPAWHHRRHALAELFLRKTTRLDMPSTNAVMTTSHHVLVHQAAAQMGVYAEIVQILAANELDFPRRKYTRCHLDAHILAAISKRKTAAQVLLYSSSYYKPLIKRSPELISSLNNTPDSLELCQMTTACRFSQYRTWHEKISALLIQAHCLSLLRDTECCIHYENFKSSIRQHNYGDSQVSQVIFRLLIDVETHHQDKNITYFYSTGVPKGIKRWRGKNTLHAVAELRDCAAKLHAYTEEFVKRKRALRFSQAVQNLQASVSAAPALKKATLSLTCDKCKASLSTPNEVTILSQCGHKLCIANCLKTCGDDCAVPGCNASTMEYQKIPGELFADDRLPTTHSEHGAKFDQLLILLNDIKAQNDKCLLFIQDEILIKIIREALKEHGIESSYLDNKYNSAKVLSGFQNGEDKKVVLILNIGNVSAAGCNLTTANHVIFLVPYFVAGSASQHIWEAAMTQAIGRARRYGQMKPVHVYHFLTVNTIDIDLFEYRSKKVVKIAPGNDITKGVLEDRDVNHNSKDFVSGPLTSKISQLLRSSFDGQG